mgnify:CR=1 FL=1
MINSIVDLMANDENIAKLYDLWWEKKCDVLRTYYQNIPYEKPPLSQNKEFKSLKNDIIREALKIGGYLDAGQRNGSEKNGLIKLPLPLSQDCFAVLPVYSVTKYRKRTKKSIVRTGGRNERKNKNAMRNLI